MKGNLARSGLCSFVTSVDFGLYSSILGTCCDCWVWAIRGHSSAEPAASMLSKAKIVRQNLIRQPPVSKSRTIASHEQDMRLTRLSETDPRRRHKFSVAKKISTGSAGHKIRRRVDIGSFSFKPASRSLAVNATALPREYPFRSARHDKTVAFSCKVLRNRRSRKS